MPRLTKRYSRRNQTTLALLAMISLVMLGLCVPGLAQVEPSAPAAKGDAKGEAKPEAKATGPSLMDRVKMFSKLAPARQSGQPGLTALDDYFLNYFQDAAAKINDPEKWANAQAQMAKADAASEKYLKARVDVLGGMTDMTEIDKATILQAYNEDKATQEALKGLWFSGRMEFPSAVYIPAQSKLTVGGRTVKAYQMAPNLIEPSNLPGAKHEGRLVYLGQGSTSEQAGLNLEGAIVLMEFNSGKQWIDAVQFGARAVVFIEAPTGKDKPGAFLAEAALKQTTSMISVPRYYITREDAAKLTGLSDFKQVNKTGPAGTLEATTQGRWERRTLTTEWLFIPGSADFAKKGEAFGSDTARQIVHVQAYKDANCIVPELSSGASSLGNLAAVVELVERLKKSPPKRPVLVSVVSDHTNALLGEQNAAFSLFANPLTAVMPEIDSLCRERARYAFIHDLYSGGPNDKDIQERFRTGSKSVGGQNLTFKEPVIDLLSSDTNRARVNRTKLDLRKSRKLLSSIEDSEYEARAMGLTNDVNQLLDLQQLYKKFGERKYYDKLPADTQARLVAIYKKISDGAQTNVDAIDEQLKQVTHNLTLRRRLFGYTPADKSLDVEKAPDGLMFAARYAPVPAVAALTLDLTFGTEKVGFFYMGNFASSVQGFDRVAGDLVNRLAILATREAELYSTEKGRDNLFVDSVRGEGGLPWAAYMGIKSAVAAQVFQEHVVPGLTLMSIADLRAREFTPQDTVAELDEARVNRVGEFGVGLFHRLITSEDLGGTYDVRGAESSYLTSELGVRKQDQFSVGVPKQPQAGALVTIDAKPVLPSNYSMLGQVTPYPVLMTNDRGSVTIRGGFWREGSVLVFGYDPEFKALGSALDFGMGEKRFNSTISSGRGTQYLLKTVIATEMDKVDLLGLTQPLQLAAANILTVIDAIQESPAPILSTMGINSTTGASKRIPLPRDGTAIILVDTGMPFKLRIGTGLAIHASSSNPMGDGFVSTSGILRDLVLVSASDMLLLTDSRLKLLAQKGVINDTAKAYQAQAEDQVKESRQAKSMGNNGEMLIRAEEGRGLAYQAYVRGLSTVNDLIKAVVIFLALVIPFCFFLTKLISPFTDINRQLALFGAVFAGMALLLRFVHPAFEIAKTPEVVILAFIILGLAMFVATVLISKFNSSMNQIVEESQLSESADASQGRLAGVAFLVGINNMKRRRIRTTLTCVTIVLVTFTMLSVISVGQGTDPATRPTSPEAPYNGFLFANPGLTKIDPLQLRRIKAHYEGNATVVSRAWAQKLSNYGEYLGYDFKPTEPIPGATMPVLNTKVLVGLEVGEKDFLPGGMPILAGRWFSSDWAEEVILSAGAAELMGIRPDNFQGKTLQMGGRTLKLVGLLEDQALERMRDQGDVPMLPMLEAVSQQRGAEEEAASKETQQMDLGGSMAGGSGSTMAKAVTIAFVPIDLARAVADAEYRTLSVKFNKGASAEADSLVTWKKANELIQYQTARVAVGITKGIVPVEGGRQVDAGQYAMTSSNSTQVGGVLKIAVPIILAATIILNTMLGSVMERRREVAIYNAIGLNPTHVMMFFLAESLVFGMIGSVAGYLIGQVLAIIFTKLNIGLNLNYSSLSVMVVIFLAIATVLVSTIYPAMMAARAAVPSGQRKWSLPPSEGDQMAIKFPFSYDAARVLGVCAYMRDYMKQNSEASTGTFLAQIGPVGRVGTIRGESVEGEPGGPVDHVTYAMTFDIAPAPYDLGVNQKLEVYAYYDTTVKAHMLAVHITRTTGERSNWLAVNQPFLESLRKRLLGWRSQKSDTHEAYYREGQRMFADAGDLPVVNGSQERA